MYLINDQTLKTYDTDLLANMAESMNNSHKEPCVTGNGKILNMIGFTFKTVIFFLQSRHRKTL